MENLFGTDGIRGIYGDNLINPLSFYNYGKAIALSKIDKKNLRIVLAIDTRQSRYPLSSALKSGLTSYGATITDLHILPTPVLSFLTRFGKFDYGVMITASHNPSEYNGIKVFNSLGEKISIDEEKIISNLCQLDKSVEYFNIGEIQNKSELKFEYIDYLLKNFKFTLKGKKVLLDCANGAMNSIAFNIFNRLNASVKILGQNGKINDKCGVMYLDNILSEMRSNAYDIGFAFDGDGDRVVAITKNLKIIDGDTFLYLLSRFYSQFENIKTVVGTIISNYGLEKSLHNLGIDLLRVDVGDKNITAKLREQKLKIGAEKAGHIILNDYSPTGDGLIASLKLCEMIFKYNIDINNYLLDYKPYSTKEINIPIKKFDKDKIISSQSFIDFYNQCQSYMKSHDGRVVMRPSGTEPLFRVLVECNKDKYADIIIDKAKNFFHNFQ